MTSSTNQVPLGRRREAVTVAGLLAKELHSTVHIAENGQRIKTSKLGLLLKHAVDGAIAGNWQPLAHVLRMFDHLERLNNVLKKNAPHPYADIDIRKLSFEEKQKLFSEVIANSKPLDQYY
jgi:hypothetical protein